MAEYNTKNYNEQGGDKTVIGGTLEIKSGASVTGLPASSLPTASKSVKGIVKVGTNINVDSAGTISVSFPNAGSGVRGMIYQGANVPDCAATSVAGVNATLNHLLSVLRAIGARASE